MPICGHMKPNGKPCKRKGGKCWQHSGSSFRGRRDFLVATYNAVLTVALTFAVGLGGTVVAYLRKSPEPEPMTCSQKDNPPESITLSLQDKLPNIEDSVTAVVYG